MIQSMTGFGKCEIHYNYKKITIIIKSLNSKNLDLNIRIPSLYREKEMALRSVLAKQLLRGKVDFTIQVDNDTNQCQTFLNEDVLNQHIATLQKFAPKADQATLLQLAMQFPDVMQSSKEALDESEWQAILEGVNTAVADFQSFRLAEGKALEKDIAMRISNISSLLLEVEQLDGDRIAAVKERLHKAISELKVQVDDNRFEQELIYYLEKLDITEEIVRLRNHLVYFTKAMNGDLSNGKKLAFISQEIGREINTMGSKANYAPLQKIVIQMKDELEKIKEQSLNIL